MEDVLRDADDNDSRKLRIERRKGTASPQHKMVEEEDEEGEEESEGEGTVDGILDGV